MDFRKLSKAISSPPSGMDNNSTDLPALGNLPPNILEALIPGYSIISRYVSAYLGFDISVFVSVGVLILAVSKGGQYLYAFLKRVISATLMSSVYIDEQDDLFDEVMAWLAAHGTSASRNRKMRAKTQKGGKADDGANDAAVTEAMDETTGLFSFSKWSARTPPRFEPYYGSNRIYHNGSVIFIERSRRPNDGQRVSVSFNNASEDILKLDCMSRNIEPIQSLLKTIRVWSLSRTGGTTTVRHPTPKDRARFAGTWSKSSSRPSRPMETVILDDVQKATITNDANRFLDPRSPVWYASRGIPYRRGYLFHGAPGTGKTSLSFALAGIFGLEIYAISLQEPNLTEGDLIQLFNGLPRRCIVLLEDVDAAGLVRDGTDDDGGRKVVRKVKADAGANGVDPAREASKGDREERTKKDDEFTLKDLAKELKSLAGPQVAGLAKGRRGAAATNTSGNATAPAAGTGVSLSGLLNAIDGVSAAEGRILIMTTNHPDRLDPALIRPGRVDLKIEFRLAMKEQIRELFVRMYAESDDLREIKVGGNGATTQARAKVFGNEKILLNGNSVTNDQSTSISRSDLEALAAEFAALVPDDTFTPAEVQNLLMAYRSEPRTAVAKAQEWVRTSLEEKENQGVADGDEEGGTVGVEV